MPSLTQFLVALRVSAGTTPPLPALLSRRSRGGLQLIFALLSPLSFYVPARAETATPFEMESDPTAPGRIDELVFARLQTLGIEPAHPCSDAVFVRRVFLDVIG